MANLKAYLAIILVFCAATAFSAERSIYTWTDERGNLHMTDEPPPSKATIKEVETYQEPSPEEIESVEDMLQRKDQERRTEDLQDEAAQAERNVAEAEKKAAEATEQAQALTQEAQDYVRRFGNTPERRKQFKYKIQEKKVEALKAQEAALEARAMADQAKMEAQRKRAAAEKAANQPAAQNEDELRIE